jgi:hypothetical protein
MQGDKGKQQANGVGTGSARALGALVFPLLAAAILALSAAPAFAAETHALKTTFGAFSEPSGIAIDQANGNVFVAAGAPSNSVEIFGPEGGTPSGVAMTKIEGFKFAGEPSGLAIDNSAASPSQGDLYVTDVQNDSVKKYSLNPASEEYELIGELVATPAFHEPIGVAVNAKGNVFVSDFAARLDSGGIPAIVEFDALGVQIARIDVRDSLEHASALAFDSAGSLYAESFSTRGDNLGVWKFPVNGSGEIEPGATPIRIVKASLTGIAIDQSTDTLYAANKDRITQFDVACAPVDEQCEPELQFGTGVLGSTERVAVAPNGDIYVVDRGEGNVAVFDGAESIAPDALTKSPSAVKQTSATLNGTVSAAAGPPASCEFQYATKASFDAEGFKSASTVPCSPAGPFTGNTPEAVKADVSGLSGETNYVFRLRAFNENGPDFGEALSLATVGLPKIKTSFIALVTVDSASIEGLVNPNGGPNAAVETSYFVEYVSEKDFKASGYANATKAPAGGQGIGSGTEDVKVAQLLSGFAPGSTYHFRVVAENEAGKEKGPDKTFTTYFEPNAGLPDGRVYEQVTPVDKNGAGPSGSLREVQAAVEGDGIVYLSGSGIPGAEGAQQYPTYLSSRGLDWSTQGLLPPASAGSSAAVLGSSQDLSRSYVAQADLPTDPANFLQRDNATHQLQSIALEGKLEGFTYLGGPPDGSVAFFESATPLLPGGAAKARNTYVWDSASRELSLAGIFNNGQPPAKGTIAGPNQTNFQGFYAQALHTASSDGARIFFSDPGAGQLYVRENPTMPQSELDGAGKCTEAALACTVQVSASQRGVPDPKGKKTATFMTAAADGSRVFFTSPGKLTDDATTGPNDEGNDLYRYDLEGEELIDITPDAEPGDPSGADVQGVFGASDDGSYVYFAANGVLAAEATPGDCVHGDNVISFGSGTCNIYLWHNGTTTFVAPLQLGGENTPWSSSIEKERTARVAADGQTLLFLSLDQLTDYENKGVGEFYRYSAPENELSCVSCNPTGTAPSGRPTFRSVTKYGSTLPASAPVLTRNLSADGDRIFFETPDKLLANDTNGDHGCPSMGYGIRFCQDVYEWEANGTGSCHSEAQNGGCLYLLSTGTSAYPAYFADASFNGNDAFVYTDQRLVGQDQDQIVDIYDARIGGGIAAQNPPLRPDPCLGETSCRGEAVPPVATPSPGSAGFAGPGNQKPSHHKKKKSHKKKKHKKRHSARKHG